MKSDVQLNLRAKESQRALIDAAADILHKSRTDFILEIACKAAEDVILDRRVFNFNDEQYAEFIDMIENPRVLGSIPSPGTTFPFLCFLMNTSMSSSQ
ncbi:TPA: DUF1778 domain-containing protein [Salmonella enterica subsp. enterica serovar Muenchen]